MLCKGKLADQNEKKPRAPQSHLCIYGLHIPTTPHSSRYTLPLIFVRVTKLGDGPLISSPPRLSAVKDKI